MTRGRVSIWDAATIGLLLVGVGAFLVSRSAPHSNAGSPGDSLVRDSHIEGATESRLNQLFGTTAIRAIVQEYGEYSESQLRDERSLIHSMLHDAEKEIKARSSWHDRGVVLCEIPAGLGGSLDLLTDDVKQVMEGLWPAYVHTESSEGRLIAYAVPLPLEENRGFWELKLRQSVLQELDVMLEVVDPR